MPLAALVEGDIFCVHGGLSPKRTTIDTIRTMERNVELPTAGPLCDLVWSDPEDEVDTWRPNSRGAGWLFGRRAV
jgi:diadenosine tetraphosphatase ApaH/serine/threonine PP2A family protein phosphatase